MGADEPTITFSIDVPDLDRGVTFYTEGLGFVLRERTDGDSAVLAVDDVRIDLLIRPPGAPPVPDDPTGRHYDRHWTPIHLDLVVGDLDDALAQALAAGATLESGPRTIDGERLATCADPFGHGFCLIQG